MVESLSFGVKDCPDVDDDVTGLEIGWVSTTDDFGIFVLWQLTLEFNNHEYSPIASSLPTKHKLKLHQRENDRCAFQSSFEPFLKVSLESFLQRLTKKLFCNPTVGLLSIQVFYKREWN